MNQQSNDLEKTISSIIHIVNSFTFVDYQSIYLIDSSNKQFIFVSDNPLFLCGLSAETVMNLNYKFYENYIPKHELEKLIEINKSAFQFIDSIEGIDKLKCRISYDFHLLNNRKEILVNHRMIPISLTEGKKIIMCIVSLSSYKTFGHAEIYVDQFPYYWEYFMESRKWKKMQTISLTETEKNILYMASEGFTISEIADKIYKSIDTIKFYRHNILEKLNVTNITEALIYATNKRLL